MKRSVKILLVLSIIPVSALRAQDRPTVPEEFGRVIDLVERGNPELEARCKLRDARSVELRLDNNLEDPEVEYVHQWGRPSGAGPASELTVTQSFDFPTVYARRARLAEKRTEVYGYEYEAFRQEILFEAHTLCIRIAALKLKQNLLHKAMQDAERVASLVDRRVAAGDANALEQNKARFEYISAANAWKLNEIEITECTARLSTLTGGESVPVEGFHLSPSAVLPPYEQMARLYEELSPEILGTLSALDAANYDVRVSRGKALPKLTVGYKRDTGPGEKLNGVVAGMTIPLFSNRNNIKRARAEAAYAEAELRRVRNDMQSYLLGLYSRAELLEASSEQYRRILEVTDSVGLLHRALDQGHISVIDYYSQLQPVYESSLTMIDVMEEYHLVCARINAVFL